MKNKKFLLAIVTIFTLFVCTFAAADDQPMIQDPWQPLNEKTFKFNSDLDEAIFQPVARGYSCLVPAVARNSISNFFQNISQPSVVINDLLQGDFLNAMADSWRFVINSTVGIFGLFDIAGQMDVPINYRANDFGLTLMYWGLDKPNYFVIPFFGPGTDVDVLGRLVDYYAFEPYIYINPWSFRTGLLGLYYLNERAQLLDYDNLLSVAALDPYVFQRDAYIQHRESQLNRIREDIQAEYSSAEDTEPGYFLKPSQPGA